MTDTAEWPLCDLASCTTCGQSLTARQEDDDRIYECGCPDLIDADDLDEAVVQAVREHLHQRLARLSFSQRKIRSVWHNATATTRRAIIRTELAAVTVSRGCDGQLRLAYVWNTELPGSPDRPTRRFGT